MIFKKRGNLSIEQGDCFEVGNFDGVAHLFLRAGGARVKSASSHKLSGIFPERFCLA